MKANHKQNAVKLTASMESRSYTNLAYGSCARSTVRVAVKTYLSCRNDTIIKIFCAANTNKDNANGALAYGNLKILGLIL